MPFKLASSCASVIMAAASGFGTDLYRIDRCKIKGRCPVRACVEVMFFDVTCTVDFTTAINPVVLGEASASLLPIGGAPKILGFISMFPGYASENNGFQSEWTRRDRGTGRGATRFGPRRSGFRSRCTLLEKLRFRVQVEVHLVFLGHQRHRDRPAPCL